MHKGLKHPGLPFVAGYQASEVTQPGEQSLDDPAFFVSFELAAIVVSPVHRVATVRNNRINVAGGKAVAELVAVELLVHHRTLRFAGEFVQSRFHQFDCRRACRVDGLCQRNARAAAHHNQLRAFAALGFTDAITPFFAGTKVASAKTSSHIRLSRWPSWSKNACQARSQSPFSSHRSSRRQQVEGEGKQSGRSFQRAPVRRIQRMPSKHSRFGLNLRPPLDDGFLSVKNGSILDHASSVSSRRTIGPPCRKSIKSQTLNGREFSARRL